MAERKSSPGLLLPFSLTLTLTLSLREGRRSSDRAAQVTGQTLNVDGGFVMHW